MIATLRVKNESRWIRESLASLQPLCSEVHVLDDHSDDGTPEICEQLGATVYRSPFEGLDEVRDKNYLLDQIAPLHPDWVIMIDGDEALAPGGAAQLEREVRKPRVQALSLRVLYLWDRPDQVRTDGVYARLWRPSVFRYGTERFAGTTHGGNFHCGNAPSRRVAAIPSAAALVHYGYMDREDRLRKYEWYNAKDPASKSEDGYRHMVIGDVFSADSRFRYAGPLQLEPLVR